MFTLFFASAYENFHEIIIFSTTPVMILLTAEAIVTADAVLF
jgi:hypothetical protein